MSPKLSHACWHTFFPLHGLQYHPCLAYTEPTQYSAGCLRQKVFLRTGFLFSWLLKFLRLKSRCFKPLDGPRPRRSSSSSRLASSDACRAVGAYVVSTGTCVISSICSNQKKLGTERHCHHYILGVIAVFLLRHRTRALKKRKKEGKEGKGIQ